MLVSAIQQTLKEVNMRTKHVLLLVLLSLFALLTVWLGLLGSPHLATAQEPEETEAQGEIEAMTVVPGALGIQGRLADAGGNPLSGSYSVTFSLYDVQTGGTALCSDTNTVSVQAGLFNSYIDYCYNDLWGQKVWLGVKVGSDPEMTPRQVIYPVAYALTVKPGAVISGTTDPILTVRSSGTGDADGLRAFGGGTGEAVQAEATDGVGVAAFSNNSLAVVAHSYNTSTNPAIFGCAAADAGTCEPQQDDNPAGVMGYSSRDGGDGVHGESGNLAGRGVYGTNSDGGIAIAGYANSSSASHLYPTLYLVQQDADGDFVVGAGSYWGTRYWRVDRTGKGFFNGGTQNSGADFAEQMTVTGDEADYEPGDVLVISASADRVVERSTEAYASAVIGVYSTQPAVLANAPDTDDPLSGIPVAMVGVVPCKVSTENGPIQRGDLLVTSATPGHAMRADPDAPQGTVLGKALQPLESGTDVISILVTLQ
jgi:hypothetical protein